MGSAIGLPTVCTENVHNPGIVILLGLARRTVRKSRKYRHFTASRPCSSPAPPPSQASGWRRGWRCPSPPERPARPCSQACAGSYSASWPCQRRGRCCVQRHSATAVSRPFLPQISPIFRHFSPILSVLAPGSQTAQKNGGKTAENGREAAEKQWAGWRWDTAPTVMLVGRKIEEITLPMIPETM